jgi:hypothetical protein
MGGAKTLFNIIERKIMNTTKKTLLLSAMLGVFAAIIWNVTATELTPPVPLVQSVGVGIIDPPSGVYRSYSFLNDNVAGIMVTNAGGAGATIVTNDFGCTNLTQYIRQVPGTVLPPGTLYTNALINPYFWVLDNQAAIYQAKTATRAWKDVPIPQNVGTLGGYSNLLLTIAQSGALSTATNVNTFVFLHSVDGQIFDTNDTWTVTCPRITGTNVSGTNVYVPPSFFSGYRIMRLGLLNAGTNSPVTTNYIHVIKLSGIGT